MEFWEYKSLKPLHQEMEEVRQKAEALNPKDIEYVLKYLSRDTYHGKKKTFELLGINDKDQIRLIKNTEDYRIAHARVQEYNKAQEEYKALLDNSLNESINLEAMQASLVEMEDKVRLMSGNRYFWSWWSGNNPKTDSRVKICEACRRRIVYETTKRDMTEEELEIEKKTTDQKQEEYDKGREGYVPQYYDCTSSFCWGSCSRCEGRQGQEMYPRIIFKSYVKVGTDWSTCGCAKVALKTYNCD